MLLKVSLKVLKYKKPYFFSVLWFDKKMWALNLNLFICFLVQPLLENASSPARNPPKSSTAGYTRIPIQVFHPQTCNVPSILIHIKSRLT